MIEPLHTVTPGAAMGADGPWIPEGPGKWSRPLRFLKNGRGWVELMRLEPGTKLGLHRHTGEVHAYNLAGARRLCSGEIVRPGDCVHERAGNSDGWEAVGDEPLIVPVVPMGDVEYVTHDGVVKRRIGTADRIADDLRHCETHGLEPADLQERRVADGPGSRGCLPARPSRSRTAARAACRDPALAPAPGR